MNANLNRKKIYRICQLAFLVYVFIAIYFLFFCDRYGRTEPFDKIQYNLVPFKEIHRYIVNLHYFTVEQFVANMAGNICLFIPFGALLFVWRGKPVSFLYVTMHSFVLSFIIECIQLITRVGVFDVDDMILNTIGGMIGYFVYLITRQTVRRYRHAKQQKKL